MRLNLLVIMGGMLLIWVSTSSKLLADSIIVKGCSSVYRVAFHTASRSHPATKPNVVKLVSIFVPAATSDAFKGFSSLGKANCMYSGRSISIASAVLKRDDSCEKKEKDHDADDRPCDHDPMPEPSMLVLFGTGMIAAAALLRRRRLSP